MEGLQVGIGKVADICGMEPRGRCLAHRGHSPEGIMEALSHSDFLFGGGSSSPAHYNVLLSTTLANLGLPDSRF